jgi:hypothetical protein
MIRDKQSSSNHQARRPKTVQQGRWLDDSGIFFGFRYLKYHLDVSNRIYFFNTYFYEDLNKNLKAGQTINYKAVQKYTMIISQSLSRRSPIIGTSFSSVTCLCLETSRIQALQKPKQIYLGHGRSKCFYNNLEYLNI